VYLPEQDLFMFAAPSGYPLATGMKRRRHDHILMAGKYALGFATRIR
jgi:hypothetical protein